MKKSRLLGVMFASICSLISIPSIAALIDNGGGLIYDDVLKITWAQPSTVPRPWDEANAWAAGLTLGGVSGWRLPYMSVAEGVGPIGGNEFVDCNLVTEAACRDNEMGYMFYHNLSGTIGQPILSSGDPDLALFPSLQSAGHWSGSDFNSILAWGFPFRDGVTFYDNALWGKDFSEYIWAVHAGNIRPIPVPAAIWLFGSGLLGLIGISRRKRAA